MLTSYNFDKIVLNIKKERGYAVNWTRLFQMQEELDTYIMDNHHLHTKKDMFEEKYLALLVELGELANETRCFKFWSTKSGNSPSVILEEYVDGVHFILSLGLEKGLTFHSDPLDELAESQVGQFNKVFEACVLFKQEPTQMNYNKLFTTFLKLGHSLGFNEEDIQKAYYQKNEVNYKRQNQGY